MSDLPRVLVGDTFKQTFINSGSTISPIVASILDGAGSIVSSGAGVDSGSGHFIGRQRLTLLAIILVNGMLPFQVMNTSVGYDSGLF